MKKNLTLLLFACAALFRFAFAQTEANRTHPVNYVDSVIYYFEKSQTAKGIDTSTFGIAFNMIHNIDVDSNSVGRIERLAEQCKLEGKNWYYEYIKTSLIQRITKSDSIAKGINYCTKIIDNYDATRNPQNRIPSLNALLEIRIPYRNSDMPAGFDFYTSKLKLYLERKDSAAISICYFSLGSFYRLTGLYDMTIYDYKKARSFLNEKKINAEGPISGLYGWANHTSAVGQMYADIGDYQNAIAYSLSAKDVKLHKLNDINVSFLNCNIAFSKLMLNELDSVNVLLSSSIPIASDRHDYPALVRCYELKGFYFLKTNQFDSSEYYLLKCNDAMKEYHVNHYSAAGMLTPNYYLAQVRMIQTRYADARDLLTEELPGIIKIRMEVLKEYKLLIDVYLKLGDSKSADEAFAKYSALQDTVRIDDRKNRSMSFEAESKITEAENTITDLETQKKIANLTKDYLIGIAALLLIVAVIIFNRFRVTQKQKVIIEKEKHRSEELLLNILPEEVAEELKAKGRADAKHFDEATVLFTDFKNFTLMSEKLSAQELVNEINYCYSAFDNIISKHGIEKIKTIGDSYMCAGGLPVANKTNAFDTVQAAIEIRDFMEDEKQKRIIAGLPYFEIRIGCNTGPVVAGIVGIKKFAYDIWGDTVNIASRMESSGEVGKVNISGSTYELVKDKFACAYRGKVQAKNKGEIDMYFIERSFGEG